MKSTLSLVAVLLSAFAWNLREFPSQTSAERTARAGLWLDHVVVAVNDLEQAAERYRALGFTLKPGRPHANGIRNWHAKFSDGTEVELLTAPEARDEMTRKYRQLLAQGDGGAYLALFAKDGETALRGAKPGYVFFVPVKGNQSPTDRPEHFVHKNSAESLAGVWVADAGLRATWPKPGGSSTVASREIPHLGWKAESLPFENGYAYLLPPERQLLKGRPIVGVGIRVRSAEVVESHLTASGVAFTRARDAEGGTHILVAPADANGIWLNFRADRK